MDPERWQLVQDLLARALELSVEEREGFLTQESPDDEASAEVLLLLQASDHADGFFTELAGRAGLDFQAEGAGTDLVGRRVGAYRLEGLLGRGGMGTVYRAERADGQFSQTVAIKLLSMGATHPETHRRFLAERQVLAQLQHPSIARLFDGGVTEDGTPYFVMELVDGTPLDAYCDANALGIDERIALFLDVCDAVSFAHKNLVVHRDLKPGNILVADGQVRLLDFGIAKLLRGDGGHRFLQTATGMGLMTPAYAAPEQLEGEPVTTATDVYALGVVLYELLTGLSPYEVPASSGIALARAVCERPIANPSTRIRRILSGVPSKRAERVAPNGVDVEALARTRALSASALARRLRGDLDTILIEALRKEPARRYESVAALAEDLRRHLQDLPVHARKVSLAYRASRFFLRHSIGAAAVGAIALLVIALLVVSLWFAESESLQSRRIAEAREQASGLMEQLTALYASADPAGARGETVASRRLLDAAVESLNATDSLDSESRATLLFEAGRVYRRIGAAEEARPLFEEVLEIRSAALEPPDERLAETLFELGSTMARSGASAAGVARLREALAMALELHGEEHLHVAQIRFELATAYHDTGAGDSIAEFREAVRIFQAQTTEPTEEHANALIALGDSVAVRRSFGEALSLYEEALAIYTELFGGDHPRVATALNGIGMLKYNLGEKEEGIGLLRDAVEIHKAAYGDEGHPALAQVLQNLGNILAFEGDAEGVELLEEAADVFRKQSSTKATDFGFCLTLLGNAYKRFGDPEAARQAYEEALDVFAAQEVQAMFQAEARTQLARLLLAEGPSERAIALLTEVLDSYSGMLPDDHPRLRALREEIEQAGEP